MTRSHDRPEGPAAESGAFRLRIEPAAMLGEVKLRATPDLAHALLAQLKEQGADASYGAEFGLDHGHLLIVALMMRDNGVWMTLRTAIEAVANRHQGTRIRVELEDRAIEIEGKSTSEMEALLRQVQAIYEAGAQRGRDGSGDGAGA
ncbi:hypothetical protein PV394_12645 [Streptomyces sp. NE06-03E]|uniref:hypothetical protein n=1 Tax=Streptomyces sp. NE06-03E TaxID=3028695 RepID=UPI0029A91F23|nr:hypothetical protein [Streptomyces sp. NE06-03E]MDX3055978.1 hypothetical protein [Streptomyces sp. NE06-03E]